MTASAGTSDVFTPTGEKLGTPTDIVPDVKPEVEIPDAKLDILKTGKDVLGDVQTGVGVIQDIEKATKGDVLSGVKATGTIAKKVGEKVTEKGCREGWRRGCKEGGLVKL